MEVHPTLEYQTIKGDKTYVEAPLLWRPLDNCPACPVLNPALSSSSSCCYCGTSIDVVVVLIITVVVVVVVVVIVVVVIVVLV